MPASQRSARFRSRRARCRRLTLRRSFAQSKNVAQPRLLAVSRMVAAAEGRIIKIVLPERGRFNPTKRGGRGSPRPAQPSWAYGLINAFDRCVPLRAWAGEADVNHGRHRARGHPRRAVSRRGRHRKFPQDRHFDCRQDRDFDAGPPGLRQGHCGARQHGR